ncbi:MAG: PQQ-like beta-propeller repeat protein [Anaerohalosphaera sp.]|nr:PQQ-like beta-propeller repeat protein [Anaerohalosphaera sp.]
MIKLNTLVIVSVLVFLSTCRVFAADWPQWRGENRDGTWSEDGLVTKFDSDRLDIVWQSEIANGYSGPTVANGRVYVSDRITEPVEQERVHCFNAKTGRNIWTHKYECVYRKVGYPDGPRASVSIDGAYVYSVGTMGHLFCLDAKTGKVKWSKLPGKDYEIKIPIWGVSSSPIIVDGLLVVQIGAKDGGCVVAYDKISGDEKWRAMNDRASYSSPIMIKQASKRVLVCLTGERVVGMDPLTGKLYWEHPFIPKNMVITVPTPVFSNNYLFVSSFYDGSLMLKVDPDKLAVEKTWRRIGKNERNTDALHCMISTPVIQGEYLYGVDSYGELRCLNIDTGDRIWEDLTAVPRARWANIHMVQNKDIIWMFNERGELVISKLLPNGFQEISRAKLIEPTKGQLGLRDGVCWAHPAYADKHIYIRNDNEIVCASLAEKRQ